MFRIFTTEVRRKNSTLVVFFIALTTDICQARSKAFSVKGLKSTNLNGMEKNIHHGFQKPVPQDFCRYYLSIIERKRSLQATCMTLQILSNNPVPNSILVMRHPSSIVPFEKEVCYS